MYLYKRPELAIWPHPYYEQNTWIMYTLTYGEDKLLHWHQRIIKKDPKSSASYADVHTEYTVATAIAIEENKILINNIDLLPITDIEKQSLQLKIEKSLTAKTRLINEEQLMLEIAIKKHINTPKASMHELMLPPGLENLRLSLFEILNETPYIQIAYIPRFRICLTRVEESNWTGRYAHSSKAAKIFYREKIARGFGLTGTNHWGKTKSAIRTMLLPRANQLLQLSSVKRMLAEARIKGQKVLLIDGFIFWYEENNQIGWIIKEVNDNKATTKGNSLWREGTIISKNHGRIVILPYTKENGENVQGHTKNAPNDGKALPRHRDEYVELPFEILEGDVMRGLFGELIYE